MNDRVAPQIDMETLMKSDSLPSLPGVAINVVKMCRDDNVGVSELSKIIELDPALASKLLKLANSPKYCRRQPMTNIDRACVVLGLKTLKIMSLSFSLSQVSLPENCGRFDFELYWHQSICKAAMGRELARLVGAPCQDEAFFCGLVGRIGQLTMATVIPEIYDDVLLQSNGLPSIDDERRIIGIGNTDVGSRLLANWQLPEMLVEAVGSWTNPGEGSQLSQLCRIVQVADDLAAFIASEDKGPALLRAYENAEHYFGLSESELDEFVTKCQEDVDSLASVLDIKINEASDYSTLLDEARQQTIEIALDATSEVDDLKARESQLVDETERLQKQAILDALTGIPNRGEFDKRLNQMIESRQRGQVTSTLSVLMIDVDHFKSFNDTYGHLAGDEVLKSVATAMNGVLRPNDFIARYGGEEFSIILGGAQADDVTSIAERVRRSIENVTLTYEGNELRVTASIGAASIRVSEDFQAEQLIKAADDCLYESKENGRNRVTFIEMTPEPSSI